MNRVVIALAIVCSAELALALPVVADHDAERARIVSERSAANARFNDLQRECQKRFVVTSCVEAARKDQSATLAKLRTRELQLADDQRREAAASRREETAARAASLGVRASEATADSPDANRPRRPPSPNPSAAARSDLGLPKANGRGVSAADRLAAEQRNQADFDAKTKAIDAHRAAVEERNAQRAAQGKSAAPLPVPSGASAP